MSDLKDILSEVYVIITEFNGYRRPSVPIVYTSKEDAEAECRRATDECTLWGTHRFEKVWVEKWRLK